MLVNLVPEFLAALQAPDPVASYYAYLDRHRPVLAAYWHNYVLDLEGPHAAQVIRRAVAADRRDLLALLDRVDVEAVATEACTRAVGRLEIDRPFDCYVMVGVGGANAGELVVGGRGIAFVCLEHFTGRANPETFGLGLDAGLLPMWIAHELAHVVRYTSPVSRSEFCPVIAENGGYYDFWETGTRITLREHLLNEGLAVLASRSVAPDHERWDYFGYTRGQYRRIRELDAFLRRAVAEDLDRTGLGLRLRYLSAGMSARTRSVEGRVIPERTGYYLGVAMAQALVDQIGIAAALRRGASEFGHAESVARQVESA